MANKLNPLQERDMEIRRLAFEGGIPAPKIADQYGITDSRVYQILDVTQNRTLVRNYLESNPNKSFTAREIAQTLRIDINKVQYVIETLLKKGYVTATRAPSSGTAGGDHRMFTNVRIKPNKRRSVVDVKSATETLPLFDEKTTETLVVGFDKGTSTDEISEKPDAIPVYEIPRYPLLWSLVDKDRKIAEAAKLLEQAGLEDLALAALGKADDFTPLEREYMKYVENHKDHNE